MAALLQKNKSKNRDSKIYPSKIFIKLFTIYKCIDLVFGGNTCNGLVTGLRPCY